MDLINFHLVLYKFIQFLYFIYNFSYKKLRHIKFKLIQYLIDFKFKNYNEYIADSVVKLEKIPTHIALIIGLEKPSYDNLANFILWCMSANIQHISLYDHKGILCENEQILKNHLVKKDLNRSLQIVWHNGSSKKNGINSFRQYTNVHLLSIDHGQKMFVKIIQNLVKKNVNTNIIDTKLINNELKDLLGLENPDLLLYPGESSSTFGFLPWHLEVTEVLPITSHYNLSVYELINNLSTFSKIKQRFGK